MKFLFFILSIFLSVPGITQINSIGIFQNHADIGKPKISGFSSYDTLSQSYNLKGSGYNIWFNRDEFQYLYKKIGGDFMLTANFAFIGNKGNNHRKTGWMIRESTDAEASHTSAVVHGDGLTVLQWRMLRGAYMRDPQDEIFFPKKNLQVIQLERIGKKINMKVAHWGEPLQLVGGNELNDMPDSVLAGLFICSHDSTTFEEAKVWNVRIEKPVAFNYDPAKEGYLPSRLEVMNVSDGYRKVIYESTDHIENSGWMPNKKLFYSKDGSFYKISAEGGNTEKTDNNLAAKNNTDQLILSDSNSIVIKDGKKISLAKNKTDHVHSAEYSPDKKYIYYNSDASGTMQIWRIKADGTASEQLTFDEYNNWYPHVSPDGKEVVFISFPLDIDPATCPAYKNIMVRMMPASGGAPKVIAYLYGGKGSLKSYCWSPDSKFISFISNTNK